MLNVEKIKNQKFIYEPVIDEVDDSQSKSNSLRNNSNQQDQVQIILQEDYEELDLQEEQKSSGYDSELNHLLDQLEADEENMMGLEMNN